MLDKSVGSHGITTYDAIFEFLNEQQKTLNTQVQSLKVQLTNTFTSPSSSGSLTSAHADWFEQLD